MSLNRKLPSVPADQFSMVPRSDVPRSTFKTVHTHKTTFDVDKLVPIFVDEVLPGDHFRGNVSVFARMQTPIFPVMDNLYLDTFYFFVPCRLVWDNWVKFMGEQEDPSDTINYLIPQVKVEDSTTGTLYDYFGMTLGSQIGAGFAPYDVNALPFRAYNLIFQEWFRDENLLSKTYVPKDDGPDVYGNYTVKTRAKRHDYFTSALPWPQKGTAVTIPLGGLAPVKTSPNILVTGAQEGIRFAKEDGSSIGAFTMGGAAGGFVGPTSQVATAAEKSYPINLYADLSQATAATINSLRLAVATQQLLEKDARGGTRYTELLRMHFGVTPQDSRLQRPEYIGGGETQIQTQAIPQTSYDASPTASPLGTLGASALVGGRHSFQYASSEHGYIIGLANIRADLTYQQGVRKLWFRQTRYDFYWPVFAFLGEQAVLNKEIYCSGGPVDDNVFGYQERWAEYRFRPSQITGMFRSGVPGSLDNWHLAQEFGAVPTLNSTFITCQTPLTRALAAGSTANGCQFLFDSVFELSVTRPIPVRSVPGLARF